MLFSQTTLLLEINVETAVLALLFSPCSSMILKCKLGEMTNWIITHIGRHGGGCPLV